MHSRRSNYGNLSRRAVDRVNYGDFFNYGNYGNFGNHGNSLVSLDFTFRCPLPNGFHARPASHLAAVAGRFVSNCSLTNLRNGSKADVKSVLSLIAADIRLNDDCSVRIAGTDEKTATAELLRFIDSDLAAHDVPLPDPFKDAGRRELPRQLRSMKLEVHAGIPVSRGIGRGEAVVIASTALIEAAASAEARDAPFEQQQIRDAIDAVRSRIKKKLLERLSATEAGILEAHLAMLEDKTLIGKMLERVAQGDSAASAIAQANAFFGDLLRRSENPLMRERAADVQGLCLELIGNLGYSTLDSRMELTRPSIIIAENLAPQQLLALQRNWVRGLVLESSGTTSHTVILARSLEIPTLVGVKDTHRVTPGEDILVDTNRGLLISELHPLVLNFYEREALTVEKRQAALARYAHNPARTTDGHAIAVAANVSSQEELASVFNHGADGIGVLRTEMLFAASEHLPSEEEQFRIYAQATSAGGGKPVVIRTFDIGADKPVAGLKMPPEDNPFLGYRGVRIYPEHPQLLQAQLRAILRASAHGKRRIHLLVPMISTLDEVRWFKDQLRQAQRELESQQIAFDSAMPCGIMVEVPSVAFVLQELCREADFFSIGTNDLSQYFFAADRGNSQVASLANVRHPGFLRFLQQIVSDIRKLGKSVTLCGDMAADPRNLPLVIALGFDEISVPGSEIPVLKERIGRLSFDQCRKILSQALASSTPAEVESLLDREPAQPEGNLLDRELILLDNEIGSKEEAIRKLIDAFYIHGRTDDPDRLEDAVWQRESVYSTGLAHGLAVPHCKSDAVSVASIGLLRLRQPVSWGSPDDHPVQLVILLAARESSAHNEHLRVFSQLARNLMDDDFREQLMKAAEPDTILSLLSQQFSKSV